MNWEVLTEADSTVNKSLLYGQTERYYAPKHMKLLSMNTDLNPLWKYILPCVNN